MHALYQRATTSPPDPDPAVRRQVRQAYEAALEALSAPFSGVAQAPQRVLRERIRTHMHELFVVVKARRVPPTKNVAHAIW